MSLQLPVKPQGYIANLRGETKSVQAYCTVNLSALKILLINVALRKARSFWMPNVLWHIVFIDIDEIKIYYSKGRTIYL